MKDVVDLNADLGESEEALASGKDFALMRYVTSVNVACGGHAGDRSTMEQVVRFAKESGVCLGAHPSYPDRAHFGRIPMVIPYGDLEASIREQIDGLCEVAEQAGAKIVHVKPHGALYHAANREGEAAESIGRAVISIDQSLILVGQAGSRSLGFWEAMGLRCAAEAFTDRIYEANGTLRDRRLDGALIEDPRLAAEQAIEIVTNGRVRTADDSFLELNADTLCVHSDTPGAIGIARELRRRLESAGVRLHCLSGK